MKLLRCRIDNFGKLTDFSFDFSEGMNVIEAENGWGKSTLAAFLKAMFYGFDTKKEAGAIEKERTLFFPWQGGTYGGELDFEVGHKQYRISRVFGKTEKTDSFHLYDLATNLESSDYTANIGEELFDLDRASFKRSIYIAQKDCVSTSSDAINAKLGDLADNTNDINHYEKAMNQLKDALNQRSPTRATGSVKKREAFLTRLSMELKGFEDAREGLAGLRELYQEKLQEKESVTARRQEAAGALRRASEESTKKEQRKQYDAILAEQQEREQELGRTESSFPKEIPAKEEMRTMIERVSQLEQAVTTMQNFALTPEEQREYQLLSEQHSQLSDSDIDEQLAHMNQVADMKTRWQELQVKVSVQESIAAQQQILQPVDAKVQPQKGALFVVGMIAGIGGAIILLTGLLMILLSGWDSPGKVVVMILGAAMMLAGILLSMQDKKSSAEKQRRMEEELHLRQEQSRQEIQSHTKDMKRQMDTLTQQLRQELTTVKTFLEGQGIYCEEEAYQAQLYELKNQYHKKVAAYQTLSDKQQKAEQAKARENQVRTEIHQFLSGLQIQPEEDLKGQIGSLQLAAEACRLARRNFEQIQQKCRQFQNTHDIEALMSVDASDTTGLADGVEGNSLEELNQHISEADDQLEQIKQALDQYTNQMNALQEQLDLRDEKEQELRENQELQEQERHKFKVLKLTQEYLQQAKEQFTARYMAPISNGFRKYYEMLTGDRDGQWMIDTNITVKVKEQGQLRETERLSAGWQDLIGICMRLALVDAMYQEEKPFLIVDDPFVNLDDEKVKRGNDMLKKVSQEYQILYFTCHQSRVPE